jgi:hypothetical protein
MAERLSRVPGVTADALSRSAKLRVSDTKGTSERGKYLTFTWELLAEDGARVQYASFIAYKNGLENSMK